MSEAIQLTAAADLQWIEAAEGEAKIPRFTMLAYSGGPMRIGGFFRPVVVDLGGVKTPKTVPIFRAHDPDRIVGHGEVDVTANEITASGVVSADNEHAREVIASAKNGFPWQASIGANVDEFESVKEGQKTTVNGRTVSGPVLVARKSTLNEISVVPLGADRRTSTKVAASHCDQSLTLAQLHARRNA